MSINLIIDMLYEACMSNIGVPKEILVPDTPLIYRHTDFRLNPNAASISHLGINYFINKTYMNNYAMYARNYMVNYIKFTWVYEKRYIINKPIKNVII